MKKLSLVLLVLILTLFLSGCSGNADLYILNWGDYMDETLVDEFESRYDVRVSYKTVGSNEEMATELKKDNVVYDLMFPSDYMIDKLIQEQLIQQVDAQKIPLLAELEIIPTLAELYEESGFTEYIVPYAWGTIGILYRTDKIGLESCLESNGWACLFEEGDTYKSGMYNSPRDAVGAALLYLGYSVNSENQTELALAEAALTDASFFAWGEDNLKGRVLDGGLDMALVYSGDFISEYYTAIDDEREINFDFYVPEPTNVWMDAMVIPTIAEHVDLAHTFINFLLEEEVALVNYEYIGYAPPFSSFYDTLYTDIAEDYPGIAAMFNPYPTGALREMFVYGSASRSETIAHILERAKG